VGLAGGHRPHQHRRRDPRLLRRPGPRRPSTAAILSTLEPPVTVALAAAVFGEVLTGVQLLGGALVLAAVIGLNLPARPSRRPALTSEVAAARQGAG
jgi:hypothetical protein